MTLAFEAGRPLAPLTSMQLGGPAAQFVEVGTHEELREALAWAKARGLEVGVLGGGSNLIVGDAGWDGLVVRVASRGLALRRTQDYVYLTAQAGEPWDDVVSLAVAEQLAGIECLAGIPGSTGATPIQNVGAYGQEVSDVIDAVEVLDRARDVIEWLAPEACAFGYRDSRFKREPGNFVVLAVRFRLRENGPPTVRYDELARALALRTALPDLQATEQVVRALRKSKGMLIDEHFVASAGSFFTNPIVTRDEADRVAGRALAAHAIARLEELPLHPHAGELRKLPAGWLIERAGFPRGTRRGAVGTSDKHALALVHHGGGRTRDLIAFATEIQQQVDRVFGVALQVEPVCWNVG